MPAPISTNKRKTVDTAPVVTDCDLLDSAISTVIFFSPAITVLRIRVEDSLHAA
jgi:hypothetical protein